MRRRILVCVAMLLPSVVGCSASPAVTHPVPTKVDWNGNSYTTKGAIQTVGEKLGTVKSDSLEWGIFAVPGYSSSQEIAVEVDTPEAKYVEAILSTKK